MPEPTSKQLEALQTQVTKLDKALVEETNGSRTRSRLSWIFSAAEKWPENCYALGGTDVSSDWSRTA
jgi:hypothetical protein